MSLMDKKFIYYSLKIKPGSHTNARSRKYMREQHQHIQMQMQTQVWTHCHGLHFALAFAVWAKAMQMQE